MALTAIKVREAALLFFLLPQKRGFGSKNGSDESKHEKEAKIRPVSVLDFKAEDVDERRLLHNYWEDIDWDGTGQVDGDLVLRDEWENSLLLSCEGSGELSRNRRFIPEFDTSVLEDEVLK